MLYMNHRIETSVISGGCLSVRMIDMRHLGAARSSAKVRIGQAALTVS
jgi:hypothetical protein